MPANDFTHIIVGAGAAGCILAARLSADPQKRVLLLEAGGEGRHPFLKVPMATAIVMRSTSHAWQFETEPVPGLDDRRLIWPRGRTLGGSTAINGMVYVRGLPIDYDLWAQAGMLDWSWERLQPFFRRSEQFLGPGGEPEHHGSDGELAVSRRATPVSPLAETFIEAGLAAGYPRCPDFNAPNAEGFGYYHFTTRKGRRESARTAFLAPIRQRPNLTIVTNSEIARVLVENGRAVGVQDRWHNYKAEAEVILAAGTIGSPKLLLLSGIGPTNQLRRHQIDVIHDSHEVGRNLQDHILIRVQYECRNEHTLHHLTRADRAMVAFARALFFGKGPMTVFPLEAGAYLRSAGAERPDIQSHFIPALTSATIRLPFASTGVNEQPGFMANASVMRPASRGHLELSSADPSAPPRIFPNYLDDARDLDKLVDATTMLREIFAQSAFDAARGEELAPGPDKRSKKSIAQWVRATANTMYHPVGTCRMGVDEEAVVDENLQVRGVDGLRVADASICPAVPSTNTMAPTMMIAEKAASLLG